MREGLLPGSVICDGPPVEFYPDRDRTSVTVRNSGSHIVQVGSHYHFFEANPVLGFDRLAAFGKRLAVPPGDRVFFPPGETVSVELIPYGGENHIHGFYGVVDGAVESVDPERALETFRQRTAEPVADPPGERL
jgi:urease subunit beta